jgi:hypothetical protein
MATIKEKSYSVATDTAVLMEKYPLLLNGDFTGRFSPAVVSHMLDYIKMCDKQ